MANERDEGLAALQRGDFQTAATLLEVATQQDPGDFQAYLYLGGVYHQLQRNADAVQALTRATELQPVSAQARYNLGVAQEQNNDLQGFQSSFQQALTLQSDYGVAREALQRVQSRIQGPTAGYGTAGAYGDNATTSMPAYGGSAYPNSEATPAPGAQSYATPPASSAPPAYGTPGIGAQPYGQQPQPYGQPNYSQPPTASPYGQPQPYGQTAYGQPTDLAGNPINTGQPAYPPAPYSQQTQPYGQAPYGAGYAPPNSYGYGGAPQYAVPQQVCKEAKTAMILSIVGIFCGGIILEPIALFMALSAKKKIAQDPNLSGQTEANVALWISGICIALGVIAIVLVILAMIINPH